MLWARRETRFIDFQWQQCKRGGGGGEELSSPRTLPLTPGTRVNTQGGKKEEEEEKEEEKEEEAAVVLSPTCATFHRGCH